MHLKQIRQKLITQYGTATQIFRSWSNKQQLPQFTTRLSFCLAGLESGSCLKLLSTAHIQRQAQLGQLGQAI